MRFPSIPTVIRTFHTLINVTSRITSQSRTAGLHPAPRITLLKSMPTIPFFGSLFSSSSNKMSKHNFPVKKTEGEWQAILSPEQFRILRMKGTEMSGTGKYDKHHPKTGIYNCAGCDAPLYKATHKFDSGCGWPAFYDALPGAIREEEDNSGWMERTEIMCANCGGHLGHIFKGEGRKELPKDERHCVNSVSINFSPDDTTDGINGESKV
ncbi:methionine-R-sulfoxide reductase B2 [Lepidopterella palustris CBS 459.81]|uniref:Peptide-methionine (R)-S-oxide reductase n=1 Tax=Lepidopterella palustris CBS 459.81 TaxID=1314670 RepID=A0A8E2E2I6_9PEZI|nr:methionine-R-sulfoxide reductase B2 [Lepidopterella palustris CBS 459.81]